MDDVAAGVIARDSWLEFDMKIATDICEGLLGSGSVEPSKSISGRRIDFLGYVVDVDQQLVGVAKKNVLKALHSYFQARVDGSMKVREFQALASYAVRYRTICGLMAPFVRALYVNIRGQSQYASVKVSPASARTIFLVRALLILMAVKEADFARPIFGFAAAPITFRIEFDASLTGIGIIFFLVTATGAVPIGAVVADLSPLEFGSEAKYQNTAEFMCVVLAFLVMARRGIAPCRVGLRGDSRSALHWAASQSFKSELICNASVCMVLVAQRFGYQVAEEENQHLPGDLNVQCDDMSRRVRGVEQIIRDGGAGWEGFEDWSVGSEEETRGLFELLQSQKMIASPRRAS